MLAGIVIAVLLAGCGSDRKAVEQLRTEQRRTLSELNRLAADMNALKQELNLMVRQTGGLDSDIALLDNRLEVIEIGANRRATAYTKTPETAWAEGEAMPAVGPHGTVGPGEADGPDEGLEVDAPVVARTSEELSREVDALRKQLAVLQGDFVAAQEELILRDPQETWRAMRDPEKLGWRLDRLARVWGGKIEDETEREAFVADVTAAKQQITDLAAKPQEELVAHYRDRIIALAGKQQNQQMQRWFEAQLEMIDRQDENVTTNLLAVYRQYDTLLALKRLAEKYKIDGQEMQNNGLPVMGVPAIWE
ncbi:MAG TPA: hypothetical protein VFH61_16320 [Thermoleophilia bacterium]|nr:hypothetical protein [Thermoleophilia bacterium]